MRPPPQGRERARERIIGPSRPPVSRTMSSPPQHWRLETDADGIAWLIFDLQGSSTNTLGSAPMRELNDRLAEIEAAKPRAVILRSAKDGGFVAGADITEFADLTDLEQAYQLVRTGQTGLRPARSAADADGRRDPRLCARRRPGACARLRLSRRRGRREAQPRAARRSCSASTRDSAAPCARRGSSAHRRRST